jgi:hypothetical protein
MWHLLLYPEALDTGFGSNQSYYQGAHVGYYPITIGCYGDAAANVNIY